MQKRFLLTQTLIKLLGINQDDNISIAQCAMIVNVILRLKREKNLNSFMVRHECRERTWFKDDSITDDMLNELILMTNTD